MFTDPDVFVAEVDAYFEDRDVSGKPYTMHGLARHMGCSRSTIINYEHYHDAGPIVDAIKAARERIAEWTEDRLHQKGYHPAGAIFSLKNNFGWKDEQQVSLQVGIAVGMPGRALDAPIVQIASNNADRPALGTGTGNQPTFASDASLSPTSLNTYAVEKQAK